VAIVYRTTLVPSKLELLTAWLPSRPWYRGTGTPNLQKAGGFRLDDPAGEVGIEFVFVTDDSTGVPIVYQVPMTYRSAALPGATDAFIGSADHGVLGTRWIYDAARDPVAVAQLLALLAGSAVPQAQSVSETPEPAVTVAGHVALDGPVDITDDEDGTHLTVGGAVVGLIRKCPAPPVSVGAQAVVTAPWTLPNGDVRPGPIIVVA
jgi:Maltokinase N-terminal cap domain